MKIIILLIAAVILSILSKKFNLREKIFGFHDSCYTEKEYSGYAAMGCCRGVYGGTAATEYLSEDCIDCPYLGNLGNTK